MDPAGEDYNPQLDAFEQIQVFFLLWRFEAEWQKSS